MLSININDVFKVLESVKFYLIGFAAVLVLSVIAIILCRKMSAAKKYMIRRQSFVAMALALVVTLNLVCFGPMSSMISLATGNGKISKETSVEATQLANKIMQEGIVMLKNADGLLPLNKNSKLNVFGWASTNPVYGGSGSGGLSGKHPTVSLLEGLNNAGFKLNNELSDFYKAYMDQRPPAPYILTPNLTLPEPPVSTYPQGLVDGARKHSDTAVIVISRIGGEGADLATDMGGVIDGSWADGSTYKASPYKNNSTEYDDFKKGEHYLELSKTEEDMVDMVCSKFKNVVVVYNGANTLELGWVDKHEQIKSVLWCPGTGQSGFNALGEVMNGTVNPSGKTADTFVYDLTKTPTWNNFGCFIYDNMSEYNTEFVFMGKKRNEVYPSFINYVEGIYVGYKYYETAAAEGFIKYKDEVQFPFGYGLSYTSFKQKMGSLSEKDGKITIDVTVTNTGSVAGKDVVEVYYNPPYTNGGIEKASANMVAFDKTDMLEPGASQTLTLSFKAEDMASFDAYGKGCYVLEKGDYKISINSDSHNIINSKTYTVSADIVYGESNPRSTDKVAAVKQFGYAEGEFPVLSRKDGFANFAKATAAPASLSISDKQKASFVYTANYDFEAHDDAKAVMPTTGAKNGLTLSQLRGKAYDDPMWEKLLDQMSIDDMNALISNAGYNTAPVASVGKVRTVDCDGPASINNNFTQQGSIGFPSAVVIANTWNEDLAHDFGDGIGKMADEMGVSGWYAPAMNTHRSAFSGRNFEYYSEDGVLAGHMAASAIQAAKAHGVYAYIKHFALNDQENRRTDMLCTWVSEQAMREIYLKPFELAVKVGGAQAAMTSFNYVGPIYAAASDKLLNTVLRGEWGFRGMTITDGFFGYGFQNADQQVRNGNDACLIIYETPEAKVHKTNASGVQAMRTSAHNIMYTVVNSRAYAPENLNPSMEGWKIALICVNILFAAAVIALELIVIRKGYKKRRVIEESKE